MRRLLAKVQIISAPVIWAAAALGVAAGSAWVADWLYFLAWWPLLFFLDGWLFLLQEESWLWDKIRAFARLAGWSVTVWLIFEVFNLYLQNWRYLGIEPRLWVRWPGYALAFATVLPGIFFTAQVLKAYGLFRQCQGKPLALDNWQPVFLLAGVACLVLPFVLPCYAFPLIWLTFFFLLDPACDLLSGDSLTRRWLRGGRQEHLCLLAAGLLCGFWWEVWNYPASAKWVYTLPVLNFGKIFEMPFLGYLGFPPFALEVAVMYNFLNIMEQRFLTPRGRLLVWVSQIAFWMATFRAIDTWTVLSFR